MDNKTYTKDDILELLNKEPNVAPKKEGNFSKKIVIFVIFMNIVFTLAILYVFVRVGSEPMTLVASFFAFTTVELWSLASIKKVKTKAESED